MEEVILSSTKVDTITISLIKDAEQGFIVRQDVPAVTVTVLNKPVGGVKDIPFPDFDTAWIGYTQRVERCLKISKVLAVHQCL